MRRRTDRQEYEGIVPGITNGINGINVISANKL